MNNRQTDTRLVRRIRVQDGNGEMHTVEGWGDFLRVRSLDGAWSDWMRNGGRLRLKGQPVNPTDDPQMFELAMTGEKLTVVASPQ